MRPTRVVFEAPQPSKTVAGQLLRAPRIKRGIRSREFERRFARAGVAATLPGGGVAAPLPAAPVKAASSTSGASAATPAVASVAPDRPALGGATPSTGAELAWGASPATAPVGAKPAVGAAGDTRYAARLRHIEQRVVELKERIFQTKTRLQLLREQVLDEVVAESRAVFINKNEMGSFFELKSVLYYLDGKKIYYQDNANGLLNNRKEFEIYNGSVIPGNHSLSVEMIYRGNSDLFSYLEGYVFKLKSAYTFYAARGRVTEISVVGYERGGVATDLEDKPYIKYEVKQTQNRSVQPVAERETAAVEGKGCKFAPYFAF